MNAVLNAISNEIIKTKPSAEFYEAGENYARISEQSHTRLTYYQLTLCKDMVVIVVDNYWVKNGEINNNNKDTIIDLKDPTAIKQIIEFINE